VVVMVRQARVTVVKLLMRRARANTEGAWRRWGLATQEAAAQQASRLCSRGSSPAANMRPSHIIARYCTATTTTWRTWRGELLGRVMMRMMCMLTCCLFLIHVSLRPFHVQRLLARHARHWHGRRCLSAFRAWAAFRLQRHRAREVLFRLTRGRMHALCRDAWRYRTPQENNTLRSSCVS
jgi:hypothetical protein